MKPMTEERFQELAMKSLVGHCTAEEKAELQAGVESEPAFADELARLWQRLPEIKEALCLVEMADAKGPPLPERFRERLHKRVKEVYEDPKFPRDKEPVIDAEIKAPNGSRFYQGKWFIGLVGVLLVGLGILIFKPSTPPPQLQFEFAVVQVTLARNWKDYGAMTNFVGQRFKTANIQHFEPNSISLKDWQGTFGSNTVKLECTLGGRLSPGMESIVVRGHLSGKSFEKTIQVEGGDWQAALNRAYVEANDQKK
jgi:hypothetical protein